MTSARRAMRTADRKFVVYSVIGVLLLIAAVAVFAPDQDENNPRPTTYNAGPEGAKATFVMLPRLGYRVERSATAVETLANRDAAHTTLIIASPFGGESEPETRALESFLRRGGRILATGMYGVNLLPGLYWKDYKDSGDGRECRTEPEGDDALARAGSVRLSTVLLARTDLAETHVSQRCQHGAAVIWYHVGAGTAVWWAGDEPLTNRGLHDDANLRLLLASIGPRDRTVLFDESEQPWQQESPWTKTAGLPITAMVLQLLLALGFVVWAYGRRFGPVRTLQTTPRTSPLEFAESMGALYHRAGAGEAATLQARRNFTDLLQRQCGLPLETVRGSSTGIASALEERFGYRDGELVTLLDSTADISRIAPARALTMVQSLNRIANDLRERTQRSRRTAAQETSRDG